MNGEKLPSQDHEMPAHSERNAEHVAYAVLSVARDIFVAANLGSKEDFNSSVFSTVCQSENSIGDALRAEFIDSGDGLEYPEEHLVWMVTDYAVQSLRAEEREEVGTAWAFAADAVHWLGYLQGMFGARDVSNISIAMRSLAELRHRENRAMREEAIQWYLANKDRIRTKDAAAEAIAGKLLPVKFRTVRDWLSKIR